MKIKGSRRLIRHLGLALAVAAFAAPAAQAMPMVSSEDTGSVSHSRLYADDLHASAPVTPIHAQRLYADDLHSSTPVVSKPGNYEPINTLARPDLPQVSRSVPADSTGFDWNDAGVGAIGAFTLVLLAGGVLLAGRHSRKSRLAAA